MRIIKIIVSALLIGILVWNLDGSEFMSAFSRMDPALTTIAFVLLWLQYPLSALKWQKSLKLHGVSYSFGALLRLHCVAFFFNNFLPTSIGGDAYRSYRTMGNARRPAHAVSAVVLERIIGLCSLVFLGYLATLSLLAEGKILHHEPVLSAVIAGFVLIVLTWLFWKTRSHEKIFHRLKLIKRLEPVIDSARVINENRGHFLGLVAYSVFYQAVAIYTISLLFAATSIGGSIAESGFVAAAAGIAGVLPISINGIGVMEGFFVVSALETGLPYGEAVLVALFLRAFMFLASIVFGLFYALEPSDARIIQKKLGG